MKGGFGSLILALVVVGASLLYVRSRFLLVEMSMDVSTKRKVMLELEQERRKLALELATLKSPPRVERIAKSELKLTQSESTVPVVIVNSEGRE